MPEWSIGTVSKTVMRALTGVPGFRSLSLRHICRFQAIEAQPSFGQIKPGRDRVVRAPTAGYQTRHHTQNSVSVSRRVDRVYTVRVRPLACRAGTKPSAISVM